MSRIVNLNSPGKLRSQLMRTSAELLRRLGQKTQLDDEVRDMASLLVYCLRQIDAGIDDSALAWEKRDYWVKAERFRMRWDWAGKYAWKLDGLIREGDWEQLPVTLIQLIPYFEDIKIAKLTRRPSLWRGVYDKLMQDPPNERTA